MEDSGTKSYLSCRGLTQVVSDENISMWPRDCFYILVRSVAAFFPCLKSLLEAKVKKSGLILLAEEI